MMPYWVRITIGAALGAATATLLWLFVGTPWVVAAGAPLAAAVGFLGSYFIWSADRLPEYEQVLFDRPNTLVTALLVLAFAGAGMGTGLVAPDAPEAPGPAQEVKGLYARYQAAADAYAKEEADPAATLAALDALKADHDALGPRVAAAEPIVQEAYGSLGTAMGAMRTCAEGEKSACIDARLAGADTKAALVKAGAAEE